MTTFNWTVTKMDCYPQVAGKTNVVFTVHWTCSGTATQSAKTYSASVYSTCSLPLPTGTNYIPYADLTQAQVLGWIWGAGVDKTATEAAVQKQIDSQSNPPVIAPALPWM